MRNFDVAVLGAGPAGAATALGLTQLGASVALLGRSPWRGGNFGECLRPEARLSLERLGFWEEFLQQDHAPCAGYSGLWEMSGKSEHSFLFSPYGDGWFLDRARFDSGLILAAQSAGASIFDLRAKELERDGMTWVISSTDGPFRAEQLVVATGRQRPPGELPLEYEVVDRLVATAGLFQLPQPCEDRRTYVEACPEGWWYRSVSSDFEATVAFFTDADLAPNPSSATWSCRLSMSGLLPSGSRALGPWRRFSAATRRAIDCQGEGWIAVGDAALSVDPLSSQGVLFALTSALAACDEAVSKRGAYQHWVDESFSNCMAQRANIYSRSSQEGAFWSRRAERVRIPAAAGR